MQYRVTGRSIRVEFELVQGERQAEPHRDSQLTSKLQEAAEGIEAEPWAWTLGLAAMQPAESPARR